MTNDWRNAHVVPLFKKGEKYDPGNYRPFPRTAVLCKIMEHNIICKNIMHHLEDNNILFANQQQPISSHRRKSWRIMRHIEYIIHESQLYFVSFPNSCSVYGSIHGSHETRSRPSD